MNNEQKLIIGAVNRALNGTEFEVPTEFDQQKVLSICQDAKLVPLVQRGLKGLPHIPKEFYNFFLMAGLHSSVMTRRQAQEFARFEERMEHQHIDYLPLKGIALSSLYPAPELRPMGDLDVLIRQDQKELLPPIMEELGFSLGKVWWDHEAPWNNAQGVRIELHTGLVSVEETVFRAYFGDGWGLAKRTQGCRYELSTEENYVYLLCHFAKHYQEGGIGVRHILDLWLYRRAHPELDMEQVQKSLLQLKLADFYSNICRVMEVLFEGAPEEPLTTVIIQYLFDSGSYGSEENRRMVEAYHEQQKHGSKNQARWKKTMDYLFPDREWLAQRYPVVQDKPWLVPAYWGIRAVDAALHRRENIKEKAALVQTIDDENVRLYRQSMEMVGLGALLGE